MIKVGYLQRDYVGCTGLCRGCIGLGGFRALNNLYHGENKGY